MDIADFLGRNFPLAMGGALAGAGVGMANAEKIENIFQSMPKGSKYTNIALGVVAAGATIGGLFAGAGISELMGISLKKDDDKHYIPNRWSGGGL